MQFAMRNIVLITILLWLSTALVGQYAPPDTAMPITGVEIWAEKIDLSPTGANQAFDTLFMRKTSNLDLGNFLSQNTNLQYKSYGLGGNSNLSMNGGLSHHVPIIWNGMNLQDPLNGGTNLSVIPTFFFDGIYIQKEASSALFGSGAMSGSIHLSQSKKFNDGLRVEAQGGMGSFGLFQGGWGLGFSSKKLITHTKLWSEKAENNFQFQNTQKFGRPTETQENAQYRQWGLSQILDYQLSSRQRIGLNVLYIQHQRNLAQPISATQSGQNQSDCSFRAQIHWSYYWKSWKTSIRNQTQWALMEYNDTLIALHAQHQSVTNTTDWDWSKRNSKNGQWQFGLQHAYESGKSDNLIANNYRSRIALFGSFANNPKSKLHGLISVRHEVIQNDLKLPALTLALDWKLKVNMNLRLSLANNYRIPTFNDLFWKEGMASGNVDLKEEHSYSSRLQYSYKTKIGHSSFNFEQGVFYYFYQDLIQWTPISGIWTPINRKAVRSLGSETSLQHLWTLKQFAITSKITYLFNPSQITSIYENENPNLIGKQLVYNSIHTLHCSVDLNYKNAGLLFNFKFESERFTTDDNLYSLDAFPLLDASAFYRFNVKQQEFFISIGINNLTQQSYQLMNNYAMPLTNYRINLKYYFHKPIKINK